MPQRLKEEVRERIVDAALAAFAREGYAGATLAAIAASAGVSTGNVYRYFADKDALFHAAVPPALAARLLRLLRRRVRELATLDDWRAATAGGSPRADELLELWIAHRRAMVVLLGRADGSPLAHVRPLVARELTRLAARFQRARAGAAMPPEARFVLGRIMEGTVEMIVAILAAHEEPAAIREAFRAFWRYQLAGLQSLLAGAPAGR